MKPGQPVSHNDASVLLRAIQRKLGVSLTMRPMPSKPKFISQRQADRVKAAQMLAAEILASVERCEAWERRSESTTTTIMRALGRPADLGTATTTGLE